MKKLFICRHAKSSWKYDDIPDKDRPLNNRGLRDAPHMGKILAAKEIIPDAIFSSPAQRAITTAKTIAGEINFPVDKINVIENFYAANLGYLIEFIQNLPDALKTVMFFGHNPGFTTLNNVLSKHYIDNIPTSGIVELIFDVEKWNDIDMQSAEMVNFEFPKKYI